MSMRLLTLRAVVRALKMPVQKAALKAEYCAREHPDKVVATRRREEMEEIERIVGQPPIPGEQVLLLFQDIDVVYGQDRMEDKIKSFWDDGSTCSRVKNSTAEKLQLRGEPITITIDTVNGLVERKTKMQCVQQVELINKYGERVLVRAFGV